MNLGDLNKVWEIKALKKAGQDEAQKILERIAKQVQPIMRKHNWRVKLLSEFCPKNASLLGLNVGGGVHVKLRLRRPNRDWDFFAYNQVLDTMLHELCHNAHGPHNASFYKLWDELRKECEELMVKGITGSGEGFDLSGRRLGGFTRQPPLAALRQTALAAAEKRAQLRSMMPSGPKRLGGDSSIMGALTPVQAAAMAAERRLYDDIWCASQSCQNSVDEEGSSADLEVTACEGKGIERSIPSGGPDHRKRRRQSEGDIHVVSPGGPPKTTFIDLSAIDEEIKSQKRSYMSGSNTASGSVCHSESTFVNLSGASISSSKESCSPRETRMWECTTCTLLNTPLAPICKICSSEKPKDVGMKYKIWHCKFCTLENSVELEKCSACEKWRYSYGPPVANAAPTYST